MTTWSLSNFGQGTLLAAIAATATTCAVSSTDAMTFPILSAGQIFNATIFDGIQNPEIVQITVHSGDGNFTITRGLENTVASIWGAGARIRLAPTAAMIQAILNVVTGLTDTSVTSNTIATGVKTFAVSAGKQFTVGTYLLIADAANAGNYMHGQVTSYSGTALVLNVLDVGGSGTKTSWDISVSGPQGPAGNNGTNGTNGTNGINGVNGTNGTNGVGGIPFIAAGGTSDAITAAYSPSLGSLTDGLLVACRAGAANTTTTPTFNPNGLGAHTITKNGGQALAASDIPRANYDMLLCYDLGNTRWELQNPVSSISLPLGITQGGTGQITAGAALAALGGVSLAAGGIFTGAIAVPDQTAGDNSTNAANTKYVDAGDAAVSAQIVPETFANKLYQLREQQTSGTAGTLTGGFQQFVTVPLNNTPIAQISGASLAANTITLPAGTYYIDASVRIAANSNLQTQLRFRNTSDGTTAVVGLGINGNSTDSTIRLRGKFTIAGSKNFQLQTWAGQFGNSAPQPPTPITTGEVEIYSDLCIWKMA